MTVKACTYSILRAHRLGQALTLGDVAKAVGVSKPSVWAWENGKAKPSAQHAEALSKALGIPLEDLVRCCTPSSRGKSVVHHCRTQLADAFGVEFEAIHISIEF